MNAPSTNPQPLTNPKPMPDQSNYPAIERMLMNALEWGIATGLVKAKDPQPASGSQCEPVAVETVEA